MLTVHKEHVWRDAFMLYKGAIHETQPLCVVFEEECDLVERGEDGGRPRRKFFQLLVHHLASPAAGFFQGTGAHCCL